MVGTILLKIRNKVIFRSYARGKVILEPMKIRPARNVRGKIALPGDKSISHRAAIIAALAQGTSTIDNFSTSRDCAATLDCLDKLGVPIKRNGSKLQIEGAGDNEPRQPEVALDCGNSGSTMRLLAGVLASCDLVTTLTGDESLRSRPMKRVIDPLTLMGAQISSDHSKPPITIKGRRSLQPISYEIPVASAQVKSAVLLASLGTSGRTEIIENPTRDHTERMLQWFGVPIEVTVEAGKRNRIGITGPVAFGARDLVIPGDISSAAYFLALAALLPDSELEIFRVGLNPTRTEFLTTLQDLGANVEVANLSEQGNEPVGTLKLEGSYHRSPASNSRTLNGSLIPGLIDELPLLAVVGTQLPGGLEIRDAAELRVKESDRISATVANLKAMGAEVHEYEDGLRVSGTVQLRGARIDSFGDHRIAMAFAIAALIAREDSEISGAECAAVSFPEFFQMLESVVQR
jgi:3-phosphoshikimate 1-carboxyvinyltransferase